jgi:hypothetical protein
MFVGGVVVRDHLDLFVLRNDVVDGAQKFQPFPMAVPILAHGDDLALERVLCRMLGLTKKKVSALRYSLGATVRHVAIARKRRAMRFP